MWGCIIQHVQCFWQLGRIKAVFCSDWVIWNRPNGHLIMSYIHHRIAISKHCFGLFQYIFDYLIYTQCSTSWQCTPPPSPLLMAVFCTKIVSVWLKVAGLEKPLHPFTLSHRLIKICGLRHDLTIKRMPCLFLLSKMSQSHTLPLVLRGRIGPKIYLALSKDHF